MHLTRKEEQIYEGEHGWAEQTCMEILVRLGELFGATRLIPIESAHISGVSYKTLGDSPAEFLQALARTGAQSKVRATLNPQSFDPEYMCQRIPRWTIRRQSRIIRQFEKMGLTASLTCTPYYLQKPKPKSHLAWAESSAVVYANSVLGASTNREGGPSALAAAIIGKTPNYGMHRTENRQPNILVQMSTKMETETDFGVLGIHLGRILKEEIPSIQGLTAATHERLKQLGAALATTGMTNMFLQDNQPTEKGAEKITVETQDLRETREQLTTITTEKPDLVFIGCPHCSEDEIRQVSKLIGDKKVRTDVELWICTSRYVKRRTGKYSGIIEESGGHVLTDMCPIVSYTEKFGIRTIATNSAKTAYYAPTLNRADVHLAPLQECLKKAVEE